LAWSGKIVKGWSNLLEIKRVEAFSEPPVNRSEKLAGHPASPVHAKGAPAKWPRATARLWRIAPRQYRQPFAGLPPQRRPRGMPGVSARGSYEFAADTSGLQRQLHFGIAVVVRHRQQLSENPTLVVLTDRNDLDDQLFGTFSMCKDLLRQTPIQAEDRDHLRKLLDRPSGGVIFTTLQKFSPEDGTTDYPVLTDRRNVIVMADEAHRSQYGFRAKVDSKSGDISYGFAKYLRDGLPNASFIGFTGTPIRFTTRAVSHGSNSTRTRSQKSTLRSQN
jgi:hypothetical protein